MRLYTRQGDDGRTGLGDGSRVDKDAARVAACGGVDELNACLGLVRSLDPGEPLASRLAAVQEQLFSIGAHLAGGAGPEPRTFPNGERQVRVLENWIDEASTAVPPLRNFILPGGTEAAARLHHARTVCRRAERSLVTLMRGEPVDRQVLVFLNRLGDLLFAWARWANHLAGVQDVIWRPQADPGNPP